MNTKELEHFEKQNPLAHDQAVDFLHCEMPIEDLVSWLLSLVPANQWGEFLEQFQQRENTGAALDAAMRGWNLVDKTVH